MLCLIARFVQSCVTVGVVVAIWLLIPPLYTPYSVPLAASLQFFEAQQAGPLPINTTVDLPWR